LEALIRTQRRALLAERSDLTHTINEALRRRAEVDHELEELDKSDTLLFDM